MTEISYIEQNGEQINLKDAKGRELLAEKQKKLIAGKGISISEDGVISRADVELAKFVEVKDLVVENWSYGFDCIYNFGFRYIGNPALVNKKIKQGDEDNAGISFIERYRYQFYFMNQDTTAIEAIFNALKDLEDTEEDFLIIIPEYIEMTESKRASSEEEKKYQQAVGKKIKVNDFGNHATVNRTIFLCREAPHNDTAPLDNLMVQMASMDSEEYQGTTSVVERVSHEVSGDEGAVILCMYSKLISFLAGGISSQNYEKFSIW
jgi:hypothetical protein